MIQFDEYIFQMGWFNHHLGDPGSSTTEVSTLPKKHGRITPPEKVASSHFHNKKGPLVVDRVYKFIRDEILPSYIPALVYINYDIRIPELKNQDSMDSKIFFFFFWWLTCFLEWGLVAPKQSMLVIIQS